MSTTALMPRKPNPRGSVEGSALWGLALATAVTYSALIGVGLSREQVRMEALVTETHNLLEGIRNWQADHAAPLSTYVSATEVGWPDADPDPGDLTDFPCRDALAVLAGDTDADGTANAGEPSYISPAYIGNPRSLSDPRLRWITRCTAVGGQQFSLQLTSFGADPSCSPTPDDLAQDCPDVGVGQLLAGATSGQALSEGTGTPSPFATGNLYVDWTVWRGAAYPAIHETARRLLWRDYNEAQSLGIDNPTAAQSGIQLGGWTDTAASPAIRHFAGHPAALARWITGIDSVNPDTDVRPLTPPSATRLDARSFAVFNRGVRYDVFDGPENLFAVPVPSPCEGGAAPRWIATIESVQVTFGGFINTANAVIGVGAVNGAETLIPSGWQAYDDGGATVYSPEVNIAVFTVLPGFSDAFSTLPPADRGLCEPLVIHGEIDSAVTTTNVNVFGALDTNSITTDVEIERSCTQSDGITPYTVEQVLPTIPRAHLADLDSTPTSPPAILLSVMAHCAATGSDS